MLRILNPVITSYSIHYTKLYDAGGVICASVEYHGGSQTAAMEEIHDKISANTRTMLEESKRKNILPREAALHLAQRRIMKAMELKRWGIF